MYLYILTAVAQGRDGKRPAVVAGYLEATLVVGRHHHMMAVVDGAGKGDAITSGGIDDHSLDLLGTDP